MGSKNWHFYQIVRSRLVQEDDTLRITGLGFKSAGSGMELACCFVILLSHLPSSCPQGQVI